MRARRPGGARLVAAVGAAVLTAAALGACGSPRTSLGTDASACFRALPLAGQAVHGRGRLVGVRHVGAAHARKIVPQDETATAGAVCLVAYKGPYRSGEVTGVVREDGTTFAVVAVDLDPRPHRLGAILVDHLPTRFQHL